MRGSELPCGLEHWARWNVFEGVLALGNLGQGGPLLCLSRVGKTDKRERDLELRYGQ